MHKSATKCNKTIGKWCKNKHGASKIIDTFEAYHHTGLAVRETEAHEHERGLCLREEQLHALEDWLNREREALESREAMVGQSTAELTRHQEALNQREASLQGRMDHMLNQRRVSMEQEFKRRRAEVTEACRADFRSKTDAALVMYKQRRETLER
jgi:hypothetical protein